MMEKKANKFSYNNVGRANVFRNKFKKSDREPDLKGDGEIMGNKIGVAAWFKEDKNGNRYLSLSFDDSVKPQAPPKNNGQTDLDTWFGGSGNKKNGNKKPPWDQ